MVRRSRVLICLITIIIVCLASCGGQQKDDPSGEQGSGSAADKQKQEAEADQTEHTFENVSVIRRGGDLAFDITFDEFVKTWNEVCSDDTRVPDPVEWESYTTDRAIHYRSPANNYLYAPGDNDALYPMLHIYTSEEDDRVVQIELSYDDHSMQEYTYSLYEEMCVNSLKCIMQEEKTDDLAELCSKVNAAGADNVIRHDQDYGDDAVPPMLFHMNGAGVYPYYEIGSRMHFSIIPVDKKSLSGFREAGTKVKKVSL